MPKFHPCTLLIPIKLVQSEDILVTKDIKFIELCMETPCWCPSKGHQHDGRKATEISTLEFRYIESNTSSSAKTVQLAET